jgi:hypothetical protein
MTKEGPDDLKGTTSTLAPGRPPRATVFPVAWMTGRPYSRQPGGVRAGIRVVLALKWRRRLAIFSIQNVRTLIKLPKS